MDRECRHGHTPSGSSEPSGPRSVGRDALLRGQRTSQPALRRDPGSGQGCDSGVTEEGQGARCGCRRGKSKRRGALGRSGHTHSDNAVWPDKCDLAAARRCGPTERYCQATRSGPATRSGATDRHGAQSSSVAGPMWAGRSRLGEVAGPRTAAPGRCGQGGVGRAVWVMGALGVVRCWS